MCLRKNSHIIPLTNPDESEPYKPQTKKKHSKSVVFSVLDFHGYNNRGDYSSVAFIDHIDFLFLSSIFIEFHFFYCGSHPDVRND